MNLTDIRKFFSEEIRAVANVKTEALVKAFAKVERERYLGPGPWQIVNPISVGIDGKPQATSYRLSDDADPRHIYHNVLIAIDSSRILNNGHPSSLASWLDLLELREGNSVLHVGCGVGYYTAIIAEAVGSGGRITAIEIDRGIYSRARANLSHLPHVEVLVGDGGQQEYRPADAIFVNAGATHVRSAWLDALKYGGRLLLPLTTGAEAEGNGMGFMLKVRREDLGHSARFLSPVMIYPCIGSRDEASNQRLRDAISRGSWSSVQSLRRDQHDPSHSCWLHGDDACLSVLPARPAMSKEVEVCAK